MLTLGAYIGAALAEIGGCFAFWAVLRQGSSAAWLLAGVVLLGLFGWLLTLAETLAAGRAFAAYGGIYIATSLAWLWLVEGVRPDRFDLIGGAVSLIGAASSSMFRGPAEVKKDARGEPT